MTHDKRAKFLDGRGRSMVDDAVRCALLHNLEGVLRPLGFYLLSQQKCLTLSVVDRLACQLVLNPSCNLRFLCPGLDLKNAEYLGQN